MRRIAGARVQALTVLFEPAMQHVGIHAVFTRRGGNRCAGLLACSDQFSLELRAVDPISQASPEIDCGAASDHQAGQEFVHKMNVRFAKKGGAKFNSDGQICEKSNIHR